MIKNLARALYDYKASAEDELNLNEDDVLFVLSDDDPEWWNCKSKSNLEGLVPSNYIEIIQPTHKVKASYDYQAQSDDELTISENDLLDIYESDADWFLAALQHNRNAGLGYIPANYTVDLDGDDQTQPTAEEPVDQPASFAPPPTHPSKVPQQKVQQPSVQQDIIQTWQLSLIDSKKKKKKGTLGVGNGSLFFSSDSDKNPVRQFSMSDLVTFNVEKRHLFIYFKNVEELEFHASSRKILQEVNQKIIYSSNLVNNKLDVQDAVKDLSINDSDSESDDGKTSLKKKGVHFKETPPSPIEAPSYSSEEGAEQDGPTTKLALALALYDFKAESDDELTVKEGDQLVVIDRISSIDWWTCKLPNTGLEGVIPASYLRVIQEDIKDTPTAGVEETTQKTAIAQELESRTGVDQMAHQKKLEEEAKDRVIAETRKRNETSTLAIETAPTKEEQQEMKQPPRSQSRQKPNSKNVRLWHDKTGQFKVDAEFLGMRSGKLRLLKVNGVTIEVPREKMSKADLSFIDGDNIQESARASVRRTNNTPKSNFDWFDFFLHAGCGIDECQRYARNFEKDRMDESVLLDIDTTTLRTLGLKEGDILRVNKAIAARKGASGHEDPSKAEQIARDEAYARQLEQEATPAPNLFTSGPGGTLKNTRRGRPTPKSPTNDLIDGDSLNNARESLAKSPSNEVNLLDTSSSIPVDAMPNKRSSSTTPLTSGFDDDAWTVKDNNPTKIPSLGDTPSPVQQSAAAVTPVASEVTTPTPSQQQQQPQQPQPTQNPNSMDSIMSKIAANKQAQNEAAQKAQQEAQAKELAQLREQQEKLQQQLQMLQQQQAQPVQPMLTGLQQGMKKGPLAPVPQNQSLLQPLIPTQTGLNFVPTSSSPGIQPQQTGMPLQAQPTGFMGMSPSPISPPAFQQQQPLQPQHTSMQGFSQQMQPKTMAQQSFSPPVSSPSNQYNPSSVFANMRAGQFDSPSGNTTPQPAASERYDALRVQQTGLMMPQQTGLMPQQTGYRPF
ncbi:hypothetical protein E3Q08_02611 [Wallemia mellicola]|uniref:Actin cytoskeleton-regulatory complex protein SLA1 n=1 Tax=Wallemia mellicola TaxID=1708541 RepID=A0AB38MTW0_9BASI|nr:hypothetical protein E3Q16_02569 [Wallemia mellicola]TIC42897.1 hypothetical protein E3Q08_02611 [Wallemia mellicola]TIC64680.1 hypothetical protein E3Q02_02521 [Wallemia mellicola]